MKADFPHDGHDGAQHVFRGFGEQGGAFEHEHPLAGGGAGGWVGRGHEQGGYGGVEGQELVVGGGALHGQLPQHVQRTLPDERVGRLQVRVQESHGGRLRMPLRQGHGNGPGGKRRRTAAHHGGLDGFGQDCRAQQVVEPLHFVSEPACIEHGLQALVDGPRYQVVEDFQGGDLPLAGGVDHRPLGIQQRLALIHLQQQPENTLLAPAHFIAQGRAELGGAGDHAVQQLLGKAHFFFHKALEQRLVGEHGGVAVHGSQGRGPPAQAGALPRFHQQLPGGGRRYACTHLGQGQQAAPIHFLRQGFLEAGQGGFPNFCQAGTGRLPHGFDAQQGQEVGNESAARGIGSGMHRQVHHGGVGAVEAGGHDFHLGFERQQIQETEGREARIALGGRGNLGEAGLGPGIGGGNFEAAPHGPFAHGQVRVVEQIIAFAVVAGQAAGHFPHHGIGVVQGQPPQQRGVGVAAQQVQHAVAHPAVGVLQQVFGVVHQGSRLGFLQIVNGSNGLLVAEAGRLAVGRWLRASRYARQRIWHKPQPQRPFQLVDVVNVSMVEQNGCPNQCAAHPQERYPLAQAGRVVEPQEQRPAQAQAQRLVKPLHHGMARQPLGR